jgi:hypothetical protein
MFSEKSAGADILISLRRENKESLFWDDVVVFSVLLSSRTITRMLLPSQA